MLFIPFFENAFKHGNLNDTKNGWLKNNLHIKNNTLIFHISNTIKTNSHKKEKGGVGLEKTKIDLLFLDIQMPDLTGLELLKVLKEKPQIVLTTAYREYAVEGFALDVTDYLVKPFSFDRFVQAVHKATELIKLKKAPSSAGPPRPIDFPEKKAVFPTIIFLCAPIIKWKRWN
ncbi:MAG: response regulator [Bacteroidota bacterium]